MIKVKHIEQHFTESEFIGDVVIGIADGLTVPFALAAGLSGTVSNTSLVVIAGISEIAAGSIAMGLGGYLAARTNREHYLAEKEREYREIRELSHREKEEVAVFLREWGLKEKDVQSAVEDITSDDERWVNFMMKYELGLEEPKPERARNSSLTIGLSYIFGGFIPLSPYIFIGNADKSLIVSILITLTALFGFGWVKGKFTGTGALKSALQTALVGGLAAGFAFALAKLIS
ncbi:VIT1/CCC1 transporter family protein [Desulfitobacterium sp. Sab5]|uniref:VIT1/CCC1 transporter family protein n=1 Tax=Desulfitobacterium TaxID=36853 RepID=UPI003CF129B7